MGLKEVYQELKNLIDELKGDLERAEAGNKAAAQRARTASIKFGKTAKLFRKESIAQFKGGSAKRSSKKAKPAAKKAAPAKAAPAKKGGAKKHPAKKAASKARPAAKAKKPAAKKRATAKLPKRSKK